MRPDPVQEMDDLLMRTSAVLSGSGRRTSDSTTGTSDDGLITVIVGPDGDVASISVDPTMLRRPAAELADGIAAAVNQAVDARPADSSTSNLIEELTAIQEQSAEQMKRMSGELTAAVTRLRAQ
ncbi:MAG TPA: YbaB/EbfC family nucleoid-associated protein [Jatrophihabitantaceae bacterium]